MAAEAIPASAVPDAGESPPIQIHERLHFTYDEVRALLQQRFDHEAGDPQWSNAATAQLAQDLTRRLPAGSELVDVDCRVSMCRVQAAHADAASDHRFAKEMVKMSADDWFGGMLITAIDPDVPEGSRRETIAFLGRSGMPLPFPTADAPQE